LAPDALHLADVHTFYGDSHILHGVSFSLPPGGVLALLGRNGAGKTTCISTIIGFLKPRDGEIRLFGEPIEGLSPERISKLGIGLVPQGRRIFPSLTVQENLVVAQQRHGAAANPWSVDRIYDMFPRLSERHTQFAGTLSGGEQQMLALARVMMTRPRLLMIDELALGLAPKTVDRLMAIVRQVNAEGTTVILVEQSVNRAMHLAERAIFLERGSIRFEGPTADLLDRPDLLRPVFLAEAGSGLD
jgi:branched-chain amino acid transport system ATP-binding protein